MSFSAAILNIQHFKCAPNFESGSTDVLLARETFAFLLCALQLSEVRLPSQELKALFTQFDSQFGQV